MATTPVPTRPPSSPPETGAQSILIGAQATPIITSAIPLQSFVEDEASVHSNFVFSLKISEKLNEKNFLIWRQQVEPYVNAHNLDDFLVSPVIPLRFLTPHDRATRTLNPEFRQWRLKDQMLLSCLHSTLSSEILARVVGSSHVYELWNRFIAYFHKQMFVLNCVLPYLITVLFRNICFVFATL